MKGEEGGEEEGDEEGAEERKEEGEEGEEEIKRWRPSRSTLVERRTAAPFYVERRGRAVLQM